MTDEDTEISLIMLIFEELLTRCDAFDEEEYQKVNKKKENALVKTAYLLNRQPIKCKIDGIILEFYNKALLERQKPDQWSVLNLIPVPKSGDQSKAGIQRYNVSIAW